MYILDVQQSESVSNSQKFIVCQKLLQHLLSNEFK